MLVKNKILYYQTIKNNLKYYYKNRVTVMSIDDN